MFPPLVEPQLAFLAVLGGAVLLLLGEWLRNDLVAVLVILGLAATGLLTPREALSGFGSEPAIVVVAIFVLSAALHRTGLADRLGGGIARLAGGGPARAVGVLTGAVAALSAFTHHVTMTAVMLPVTLSLARERGIPPSKLLMPLSFAASLGTTITLIGAPAFLIASGVLRQAGRPGLGIFSIAPIGIALSVAGVLFLLTLGRWLLPARRGGEDGGDRFRLDDYFTELAVLPDSPFVGATVAELEAARGHRMRVVGWVRAGRRSRPPFGSRRLRAGDVLLVRAAPEQLVAFREERGLELHPVQQYERAAPDGGRTGEDVAERLVQAVVAPGSPVAGQSLADLDFRRRYGALVLGLWRQQAGRGRGGDGRPGSWFDEELARIRLRPGDVLVLQGDDQALARIAEDASFLMMVPFHADPRRLRKGPVAAAIMLGTVAAASAGAPLDLVAVAGALAMVVAGCTTATEAYRAVDTRIYVFIAGALPLGLAMEKSGVSGRLAGGLQGVLGGWPETAILLALFAVVAVLTQFMSDAATTAVFAPVGVALAQRLGHAPEAYAVTVAMAAVAAFLTPIGHHGNLLVYGPGGYRFTDFVRVGTPLTGLVAVIVAALAPLLWRP